ncbi:MAG: hypothetical protein LJE70_11015 [Chromatiaceae bacterium]|nr:hypothetical protein [Chromatiaceae bacterium]
MPLLSAQAEQIIAVAELAPHGRGTNTLLDRDVRRTWQVGADRVRISGRLWVQDLPAVVDTLSALARIDSSLAQQALNHFLTHPRILSDGWCPVARSTTSNRSGRDGPTGSRPSIGRGHPDSPASADLRAVSASCRLAAAECGACTCTYCVEEWNRNNTRSLKNEEQK